MNIIQRIILIVMATLICALILYPPYIVITPARLGTQIVDDSGYAFLFDLPHKEKYLTQINITLLATPICGVLLVGSLLFMITKKK